MLILEIAAVIILAVLVLAFLPIILRMLSYGLSAVLLIAIGGGMIWLARNGIDKDNAVPLLCILAVFILWGFWYERRSRRANSDRVTDSSSANTD